MLYDLSFFFLVIIIIIQNLIFGVIIDTFADLRAEKNRKDNMLKNTCFICGECEKWRDQSSSKFQLTVWLALVLNLPPHFLPFLSPFTFPPFISLLPSLPRPPGGLTLPLYLTPPSFPPGLQRSEFENKEVTFEFHISREHNLWHYLYFIVHLNTKDTTEFTGPESYVYKMISVSNTTHEAE